MEQKTVKTYLPTTYEQFLQQKKKVLKQGPSLKLYPSVQESAKDMNLSQALKTSQIDEKEKEEKEEEEEEGQSKGVTIVERIIHSDYQKMFDEFHNNKFDSIKNKINGELKRLKESPPIDIPSVS